MGNGFAFNNPHQGIDLGHNVETAVRTLKTFWTPFSVFLDPSLIL